MLLRTTTMTRAFEFHGRVVGFVIEDLFHERCDEHVPCGVVQRRERCGAMEDVLADRLRQVGVNPTYLGQHAGQDVLAKPCHVRRIPLVPSHRASQSIRHRHMIFIVSLVMLQSVSDRTCC